ncbi:MAG TPA: isocitrate lyase/phosphoenolpyruvate mutase family protein [Rhizomicrobium sp.]|jgi:2-methylisocitrate lyase-like PEP mutase family enzyme|nr:isocitrate lyase/phosphoenolpyruvate mutase family protein [Rhizomicrobium sp.]
MTTQAERLEQFRALHAPGRMLVLPNAWDAASARMVQELGAGAIATSSAAVAWSHGYPDGDMVPNETAFTAVKEILRVVSLPLSVDSEGGYSDDPEKVAAFVLTLIELGVAGINLEDGKSSPELLGQKIAAIKGAAKANAAGVFINARCDVYLHDLVPDDAKLAEMIRRGKLYRDAGADGLFVPAMHDLREIGEVVSAIDLPINILAMRVVPPIAELKSAGVRRVSIGALTARCAYGAALRGVTTLLKDGRYDAIFATSADCPDFNKFFG